MNSETEAPEISAAADPCIVGSDLSLIQRAVARLAGIPTNADSQAESAALLSRVSALSNQAAALTIERDEAKAELETLRAELCSLETALANPAAAVAAGLAAGEQVQAAITASVAHELRTLGVPASSLPKPAAVLSMSATFEDIKEQLAAASSAAEKQALLIKYKSFIVSSN